MRVLARFAVAVFIVGVVGSARAQGLTVTTIAVGGRAAQSVPEVRIRKPGAKSAQSEVLTVKDTIATGTEISLPQSARVELTSSNGNRITLHPGSRFVAGTVSASGETHQPLAGRIDFDVKNALDFFNVQYERITAAVKGTVYAVEIAPGATFTIAVREGIVEVERPVQVRFVDAAGGGSEAGAMNAQETAFFVSEDLKAGERKTYRLSVEEYLAEIETFADAEAYFTKALAVAEAAKSRPRVLRAILNLMELYWRTGRFAPAAALEPRCMSLAKSLSDLRTEAQCVNYAGLVSYERGEFRKAIAEFDRALEINRKVRGVESAYTAANLNNLAISYRRLAEFPKAIDYSEQALAIRERLAGGRDSLGLALMLKNLGVAYDDSGQHRKGLEYLEKALAMTERVTAGRDHFQIALALNAAGNAYVNLGDAPRAVLYHQRALDIANRVFASRDNQYTASTMHFLAVAYLTVGEFPQAIDYFDRTLAMRLRLFGNRDNVTVAATLNGLGRAYLGLKDTAKAIDYLQRGLAMRERVFEGRDHPNITGSLVNLSRAYLVAGDPAKAIEYGQRARAMRERLYGKDHRAIAPVLLALADAHAAAGDAAEAAKLRKQAAAIRSRRGEK